jgi:hypothetical protein
MKIHSELKPKKIKIKIVKHHEQIPNLIDGNVVNVRMLAQFGGKLSFLAQADSSDSWNYLAKTFNKRIKNI